MNTIIDKECKEWLEDVGYGYWWLFDDPEWQDVNNITGNPECLEQWKLANKTSLEEKELVSSVEFLIQFWKIVMCFLGLVGNALVIYLFCRYSKMKTVRNTYILNLAIADVLYCINMPFVITSVFLQYWPFGNTLCKPHIATINTGYAARVIFILTTTVDRYFVTCHPKTAGKFRTKLNAIFVSFFVWILSALFNVPSFIYADTLEFENQTHCELLWPDWENITGHNVSIIYWFVVTHAIPLVLTLIFFTLISRQLRKPESFPNTSGAGTGKRQQIQKKVTRLLLALVAVHYFCITLVWSSYMSMKMTAYDFHRYNAMVIIFILTEGFSDIIFVMNPILYVILLDSFRKSFKKVFSCGGRTAGGTILLNSFSDQEESNGEDMNAAPIHLTNPNNSTDNTIIATSL